MLPSTAAREPCLILNWKVHGSAFEMGWDGPYQEFALHLPIRVGNPSDGLFFLDGRKKSSSGKQPFPCFASVCGTVITIWQDSQGARAENPLLC